MKIGTGRHSCAFHFHYDDSKTQKSTCKPQSNLIDQLDQKADSSSPLANSFG